MKNHDDSIRISSRGLTRRRALGALATSLVALPACLHEVQFSTTLLPDGQVLVPRAELAQLTGAADVLLVRVPGVPAIAVRRSGAERHTAVLAQCTHRGCEVVASPQGYRCPCHGSQYDLAGEVIEGPAERPLPALPVRQSSDGIAILLGGGGR